MAPGDEGVLVLLLLAAVVYLSPIWIAFYRHHPFRWIIAVVCMVTGWTAVGWAAALAWAIWPDQRRVEDQLSSEQAAPILVPAEDDRLVQLERLGKLKAAGALTEAEFQAEKNRILAS